MPKKDPQDEHFIAARAAARRSMAAAGSTTEAVEDTEDAGVVTRVKQAVGKIGEVRQDARRAGKEKLKPGIESAFEATLGKIARAAGRRFQLLPEAQRDVEGQTDAMRDRVGEEGAEAVIDVAEEGVLTLVAGGVGRSGGIVKAEVRGASKGRKAAARASPFFDAVARQATRNPDSPIVVLGKFAEGGRSYTKVAAHYKATYMKVENWAEVTRGLSESEIWNINRSFLLQQVGQGKQIIFSHNPAAATGFFEMEVDFVKELGYRIVQDGWVWRAVR